MCRVLEGWPKVTKNRTNSTTVAILKIMSKNNPDFQTLYPIESFGIREISLSGIRVEWLANRLIPNVPFPHKHSFYQIIIIQKGSGTHQIDFTNHKVRKNQVFIMKPGQVHSWNFPQNIEALVIDFSFQSVSEGKENTLERWNEINTLPDALSVEDQDAFNDIKTIADLMFREFQEEDLYFSKSLKNLLSSLMIKLIRVDHRHDYESQKVGSLLVNHFHVLVEEYYKTQHSVKFYAEKLGQPPKTMSMAISRATGSSPHQIIHKRLLLEAKRLLAFSSQSISEVGYDLGFDDYAYFIRFFKKHEKLTPAAFRKNLN